MPVYSKIFEDQKVVVIDKLERIPVIAKSNNDLAISSFTSKDFPSTIELPDFGFVHRLDNLTKGLLIIAKDIATYNALRIQFSRHLVEKTYLARVAGIIKQKEFVISYPIAHDKNKKKKMLAVKPGYRIFRSKPRDAISYVELIKYGTNYSDLRIRTNFGVRHQIRVHLASVGFPILGDILYGKNTTDSLMLIAKSLKIDIGNKNTVEFVSKLDLDTI